MNDQITSAAELDALPARTRIAIDGGDDVLTKGHDGEWRGGPYDIGGRAWVGNPDDAESHLPVTVLYRPDQPQRVQPSREDVADALIQARSSGMCHFGKVCDLCDCGLEGHTDDEARQTDSRTLIEADAVLALFASAPTVAEVARKAWARGYSDAMGDYEHGDPLPPNPYGESEARTSRTDARCTSDITLRDEEHRLCRCVLPAGHVGSHDDGAGVWWTDRIEREARS